MSINHSLEGMPLFDGLSEEQLGRLLSLTERTVVPDGAVILEEDGLGDSLFILASGSVDVTRRLGRAHGFAIDDPKEKTIVRLEAPQFFGEMGLLENAERSATITAHGACELLELTRADFSKLVDEDLGFGYLMVRNIAVVMASRLRRTDRDVLKLTAALSLALGNR
ncbi:MAG: cyclic nucleotide-binding protein [Chloroflexi bacterium]|nr:cyclic nucleotide-binding protein [Chloroflexota bacterium]